MALLVLIMNLTVFFIFTSPVIASRFQSKRAHRQREESSSSLVGQVLDGRFLLVEELRSKPYGYGGHVDSNFNGYSTLLQVQSPDLRQSGFNVGERLGTGGYGSAYKAKVLRTGKGVEKDQEVVVKIFDKQQDEKEKASQECTFMQKLQHGKYLDPVGASRLLKCFEDHMYDGGSSPPFIVLEYGGKDLDGGRRGGDEMGGGIAPGDIENLMVALKQMLQGVRYLKRMKLMHRDLKPPNVLIRWVEHNGKTAPVVKLIDFGLSTEDVHMQQMAKEWDEFGDSSTYFYIPPEMRLNASRHEMAQKNTLDALVDGREDFFDVWSVGYTALEMVCQTYVQPREFTRDVETICNSSIWPVKSRSTFQYFPACKVTNTECEKLPAELRNFLAGALGNVWIREPAESLLQRLCHIKSYIVDEQSGEVVSDEETC